MEMAGYEENLHHYRATLAGCILIDGLINFQNSSRITRKTNTECLEGQASEPIGAVFCVFHVFREKC